VKQVNASVDSKAAAPPIVVAAVAQDAKGAGGTVVVASDKNPNDLQTWYTAADAKQVSDLEWDPKDGSLWVVDNGALYHVHGPGDQGPSGDSHDPVALPAGGELSRFKPSPDGSRALVVTDPDTQSDSSGTVPSGTVLNGSGAPVSPGPAFLVTVDHSGNVPVLSADTVPLLPSVLASATDAAWADGRTAVLLGVQTDSNTLKLFKVYSDGSQDSAINDPEDAPAGAQRIAAVTSVSNGHSALWVFSDGAGPGGSSSKYVYFKGRSGTDSSQELGSSPVIAASAPS